MRIIIESIGSEKMKKHSLSLNCCPKCGGEGKIWNFENHEEPDFYCCELCRGENTVNN
jgi:hypothetical protein